MRRYIFLLFLFISAISRAQYGNEWIDPGQPYVKISTARDAVYHISYNDLTATGFPVAAIDPEALQLYHRGQQCAIHIEGGEDGSFDDGDYILFYGMRNDGRSDTPLYGSAADQPHQLYNLFSDTTAFFLTHNAAAPAIRMELLAASNSEGLPAIQHHTGESLAILRDNYSPGAAEMSGLITTTAFGKNEGWCSQQIQNGQFLDFTLSITDAFQAGGLPEIELVIVGRGEQPSQVEVMIGSAVGSLRSLANQSFDPYDRIVITEPLQWSDFSAQGNTTVRIRSLGAPDQLDPLSLSYVKVSYPQATTMGSAQDRAFWLPAGGEGEVYLEVDGLSEDAVMLDITDPERPLRVADPGAAIIEQALQPRRLIVSQVPLTPTVQPVSFTSIDPESYDYVIISHAALMKPGGGYGNVVDAFASYRASDAGGSYRPLVVDVKRLYDQFNYGEVSSLAIRRFMKFMVENSSPQYLFIIGNGLDIFYDYFRAPQNFPVQPSFVPSAGFPASDAYFTFNLDGMTHAPAVPTGRITAVTPEHVAAYLEKVKEMESLPYDGLWRKNILHLTGGIRPGEPARFSNYAKDFQTVAESIHLGGNVKAIAKQSTNPVEFINIKDEVNKGLNLITFFGHSASTVIDFDIGFVTNPQLEYDNKARYPMFLINGCSAGSFFINTELFGEDWINASNKGAIGFIAHTSYGLENTLKKYSDIFYEVAYGDSSFIRKGIGDIQKEVAIRYMEGTPPLLYHQSQVQQMLLLGDPAVRLFGAGKPDYAVESSQVFLESFDGQPFTALSDSFAVRMIVPNYGMALKDTLRVRVTRTFADESTTIYDTLFSSVLYEDTLTVIVKRGLAFGGGDNSFEITLDPDNDIPELSETNNSVVIPWTIPLNRTKNLFPTDFAIVGDRDVKVWMQSTDLLSANREYEVEVDTLYSFDSPYKFHTTVSGEVMAGHSFELPDKDSTVYYWRTRFANPLPGESEEWEQSSFTYIANGPEGWAQIEFQQLLKNSLEGLVHDEAIELTQLEEATTSVDLIVHGSAVPDVDQLDVSVRLNQSEYQINTQWKACRLNTINLIAFEKVSTAPYAPVPIKFQDFRTCGRQPQVINSFTIGEFFGTDPDTGEPAGIIEAINNIQSGDSVVFFSIENAGFSAWPMSVKEKLGDVGISVAQIESLTDGEPVVIFGKKGIAPGAAVVHRSAQSPAAQQTLIVTGSITGRYTAGSMRSTLIGPALEWHELVLNIEDPEPQDISSITVIGVALNGDETTLMEEVTSTTDLSSVNAEDYPYMRLQYHVQDELNLTATQLEKWMVLFSTTPEGILWFDGTDEPTSVAEGESWVGRYGFVNISGKEFSDSLKVDLGAFNETGRSWKRSSIMIEAPAPGDTTFFSHPFDTRGARGPNTMTTFVNPRILPEQYYDNNLLELRQKVWVEADVFRPVMEVTVDGRILRDGDFVSNNPQIGIRVWDDNSFLLKSDTLGIKILLHRPCDQPPCENPAIYFSRDDISWTAATDSTDFYIYFRPEDLPDGIYTLSVSASDVSGNPAGTQPYEVSFEVREQSRQVMLAPYPNPGTSFVFTLTLSGESAPDEFAIQVYGVDGRLVREILPGRELHIGTNEIHWDATDDRGYPLPAGIYIYRLILKRDNVQVPIQVPIQTSHLNGNSGKVAIIR